METKEQTFERWFRAQFGTRRLPGTSSTFLTDEELQERILAGKRAEAELTRRLQWDAKRDAALKAWCAR